MNLDQFFDQLTQNITKSSEIQWFDKPMYLQHLELLRMESAKPPDRRTITAVRSSWQKIKELKRIPNFFAPFEGDEELKTQIRDLIR
jgi:hypothetical protein